MTFGSRNQLCQLWTLWFYLSDPEDDLKGNKNLKTETEDKLNKNSQIGLVENKNEDIEGQWKLAVRLIDHVCFFIFLVLFLIFFVVMFYPYNSDLSLNRDGCWTE